MFRKILVANRGEIAVRILRAAREMGIATVAVYSEADRNALHPRLADEAECIGPAAAAESYLSFERIFESAERSGADAIHPGYGFLAENDRFAAACEERGIVFIGPRAESIRLLGSKTESRRTMEAAGVPIIPGMRSGGDSIDAFTRAARDVGYPVLIKASGGGGGKGMRVVRRGDALGDAVEAARREALSAFGDPSIYLEKLIERPRHVEFQIVGEATGEVVHLFERECSIQRRHQKIIEESPSPALDPDLRRQMGETAIRVARAASYTNAGTVEFLLAPDGGYYFLEVNTRIQVEHPVTEMTTGVDLVKAQIRIAGGEPSGIDGDRIAARGHAIECRVYAEDPENGFLPSAGKILFCREPQGPGVRVDSGVYSGYDVPVHYDPILSKVIVHAATRREAIARMKGALDAYPILGIRTTVPFLRAVLDHDDFASGETTTDFVEHHFPRWEPAGGEEDDLDAALVAAAVATADGGRAGAAGPPRAPTPWETLGRWEIAGSP